MAELLVRGGSLMVAWSAVDHEVLGSISDPIKLFSRQPAILKFVHCRRTEENIGGKNTFWCFYRLNKHIVVLGQKDETLIVSSLPRVKLCVGFGVHFARIV